MTKNDRVQSCTAVSTFCSYASIQPFPAAPNPSYPSPPPGWLLSISIFLPWMPNSQGWGLLSYQIRQGGDKKRGHMPCPPSPLQHFSAIAQSNSAVLNISICNFFVSSNVFLCNTASILIKTSRRDDMHQFMVLVLI